MEEITLPLEAFLQLSTGEVAHLVRARGPQVCVFPINGTRRWFMLEHAQAAAQSTDPTQAYIEISGRAHLALYQMLFDHGLDTVLTPVFGAELLTRGEEYMQRIGADGLARLTDHPDFLNFYDDHDVRVRFYGDYRNQLAPTPHAWLNDRFDALTQQTLPHTHARLFYGVFGNDATEAVAAYAIQYHQQHGRAPDRRAIVEMYYGEYVPPASLFIGFDKFSAFDMPLLALGEEDLYFSVAPSLYLTEKQLRIILYDHLYTRRVAEPDYVAMPREDLGFMKKFYAANREQTLGVGKLRGGIWYPLLD